MKKSGTFRTGGCLLTFYFEWAHSTAFCLQSVAPKWCFFIWSELLIVLIP